MIEFTYKGKTKLAVDFTFFATIALFFYFDKSGFGILGICACVIHEAGHLMALFLKKQDFNSLIIYGGGIKIKHKKTLDASVCILAAGCLLNIAVFIVFYYVFPINMKFQIFAIMNLLIGVFNLLPIRYFDGGRLLEKALINALPADGVSLIMKKIEIITALIGIFISIFTLFRSSFNFSFMIVMIYILFSDIMVKTK
ncbi:MAG: site-2 protease family protein [Oscillospiraceae bacterium]|nr:site-2 protease family protein [Oscillospiraceae bacterium]